MAQPTFILRTDNGELDLAVVTAFEGSEAISSLYRYDIDLKIPASTEVDLDAVLQATATFAIEHDGNRFERNGIFSDFEMRHTAGGYSYYHATLVPRLWRLSLYPTNEVYVGTEFQKVGAIIRDVLTNAGFADSDFKDDGLTATYPDRSYTCQFGETDFHFVSRLMEREGIWYRFEQASGKETLILQDDADYPELATPEASYSTNPDDNNRYRSVTQWVCRKQRLPNMVVLRDYNYEQPSLDVSGSAEVDPNGIGTVVHYGENFDVDTEGNRLATVRAQELAAKKTVFHGAGAVPGFMAGSTFTLKGHPAQGGAWNDKSYLLVAVNHQGENLDNAFGATKNSARYSNTFTAIPAEVQFRPERVTATPRFHGTMTAVVHADNTASLLAEVNETGHYRVRLPFDRAGANGEKASHWVRMLTPYAGADQGTYFPLKANTEVLLTFINGDPDRPVIAGAVPNGSALSLLTAQTANQATIATPDLLRFQAGGGTHNNVATARYMSENGGGGIPPMTPLFNELNPVTGELVGEMSSTAEVAGEYHVERVYGDSYRYADGGRFSWGSENTFSFGNDYEELHEGMDHVADTSAAPASTRYNFTPYTGAFVNDPEKEIFEMPVLGKDREKNEGLIEKNWGNKLEYHYGASYNWAGGTGPGGSRPEYNYGNSYTENLQAKMRGTFATEYASTKHDSWKNESRIDAATAAIEKSYGPQYSYHNGFAYEVHEGDSRAETWGNSDETVHGNLTGTVHGNTNDTIHGDTYEMVYGHAQGIVHGRTNDMVMGGVNDMFLGGKNEMTVAAINNMALSIENNIWLGLKTDIQVGGVFEMTAGPKIELKLTPAIEASSVADLRTKVTEIDSILTSLENAVTVIKAAPTKIANGALSLNLSALKFW